jgi:DNA processing protein
MPALTEAQRRDWVRLARTENIGPVTFRQLLRRFGTPRAALDALPELARHGGRLKALTIPTTAQIDDETARLEALGGRFVFAAEPDYPEALAALDDAPPVLSVLGRMDLFRPRAIAVVGARNASLNGRKMAERLAADLGQNGIVVVSGLARGIDAAAHRASLATGSIAVLAGGVDKVYPEENRALYNDLTTQGAVLSDQPLGVEPRGPLFPRRNRLISGLALGVVVVEAAMKSGSLITARYALEQGREVFAVPGSPLDPRAAGPNDLLRQGATLATGIDDIMRHIYELPTRLTESSVRSAIDAPVNENDLAQAREEILTILGPSPVEVDELVRECQLSPSCVVTVLLELELAGRIERQPGNRVARLEE